MFNNPIIQRYRFSQFRAHQLWIFGALYGITLFLIFLINTSIYTLGQFDLSLCELYRNLFIQISLIQFFLLWLFMPMNCSNTVPREMANRSFDFFRLLPLSATQKACGIMIGRNLLNLWLAGINFCILIVLGILGQLSVNLLLQLAFLMVTATFTFNCLALLMSIFSNGHAKSNSSIILIVLSVLAFGPILGFTSQAVNYTEIETHIVFFFGLPVPILYLISGYVLVAGVWAFAGIRRRFTYEYEPLFSRKGALGFEACYLVLTYAIFHYFLLGSNSSPEIFFLFYGITLLPLMGICLLSVQSFDKYIELSHQVNNRQKIPGKIFLNSNLLTGLLLFLTWAAATAATSFLSGFASDYCILTTYFLTAWLIVLCLIELYAIYFQSNEKIGYLLAFTAGLYMILPMLLGGIFENDFLSMFSPISFICGYEYYNTFTAIVPILIVNVILLVPLAILIRKRYAKIAHCRQSLDALDH